MSQSIRIDKIERDLINRLNSLEQQQAKLKSLFNQSNDTSSNLVVTGSSGADPTELDHIDLGNVSGGQVHYNGEVLPLDPNGENALPEEGDLWWNQDDSTINVKTRTDMVLQVGQETYAMAKNETASQIDNGMVVYLLGSSVEKLPSIAPAKADNIDTAITPVGLATVDIPAGEIGQVVIFGAVRDFDTSHLIEGERVYMSADTAGALTSVAPVHPNIRYELGFCGFSDATNGYVGVTLDNQDILSFYNGTMRESFDAFVSSDGATTELSLERDGGGDLTMRFSDGSTVLDTTPALTIELTAGTATVIQSNYVYIPKATKVLTNSTTNFPTEEHIKIAYIGLLSHARTQTDGDSFVNQNWNDADASGGGEPQGHLTHIGEHLRLSGVGANWFSGGAGNGEDDYLTLAAGESYFLMEGAVVYQLHRHTFPAFDQSAGDLVFIVNDPVSAYLPSSNLFDDITTTSTGVTIGNNRYFNLVFIGVGNKTDGFEPVLCNLPSGFYTSQSDAENDVNGHDNFTIPREFLNESSTAFLVCRVTFQMGATWNYLSTTDLRGTNPQTASGGGAGGAITSFNDSTFDIHNLTDVSKIIVFDASNITTGNTRQITMPDLDVTLHNAVVAGDLDHNDLSNIDAGDINHLTDAQIAALHSRYLDSEAVSAMGVKDDANPLNHDQGGGGAGSDTSAIHDDESGEIFAITNKAVPKDDDIFIIESSVDSYAKRKLTRSALVNTIILDELDDVVITSLTDDEVLLSFGGGGGFHNQTFAEANIMEADTDLFPSGTIAVGSSSFTTSENQTDVFSDGSRNFHKFTGANGWMHSSVFPLPISLTINGTTKYVKITQVEVGWNQTAASDDLSRIIVKEHTRSTGAINTVLDDPNDQGVAGWNLASWDEVGDSFANHQADSNTLNYSVILYSAANSPAGDWKCDSVVYTYEYN